MLRDGPGDLASFTIALGLLGGGEPDVAVWPGPWHDDRCLRIRSWRAGEGEIHANITLGQFDPVMALMDMAGGDKRPVPPQESGT